MRVFASVGTSPALEHEGSFFSSASVKFTRAFESVVNHVPDSQMYAASLEKTFVGITKIGATTPRLPTGLLVTATFPAGTDMSTVAIDYTSEQRTNIEVEPDRRAITFSSGNGPAFLVLSGSSETEKELRVFAADRKSVV